MPGKTKTDAEGRFTIANAPRLGSVTIVYQDGNSWMRFLEKDGLESCYETPDRSTCAVGTIRLEH